MKNFSYFMLIVVLVQFNFVSVNADYVKDVPYVIQDTPQTPNKYFKLENKLIEIHQCFGCGAGNETTGGTYTAPLPPSNLLATSVSTSQINLSWDPPSGTVTGYMIEQKNGSFGEWQTRVGNTETTATSRSMTGLIAGTLYYYRVSAINAGGTSLPSNEAYATTSVAAPATPTGLTASASSNSITVSWSSASGATSYKVQYKLSSASTWTTLSVGNVLSYAIPSLTSNTYYNIQVIATNSAGVDSSPSTSITVLTSVAPPRAPTGLTASATSSSQIYLSWVASSDPVTGYRIDYKIGSGSYSTLTSIPVEITGISNLTSFSAGTSYTVSNLSPNTQYTFKISSLNSDVTSTSTSNEASAITNPATPNPPEEIEIPKWIRDVAKWWADNSISDDSFVHAMQWLIQNNIIEIPPTSATSSSATQSIPAWIKTNARWWSEGIISDETFVQGLQYLIKIGVIRV